MALALRWFFVFALCLATHVHAAVLHYKINGLDKKLETNTRLYLDSLPEVTAQTERQFIPKIHEAIQNALMALGYYSPRISLTLDKENPEQLNIDITPGNPIIVRSLQIVLNGDAADDRAFRRLQNELPIKEGDILNHGHYDALKNRITDLTLARGYFDSQMPEHSIHVYPDQLAADIHITLDSGTRYKFGSVRYGSMSETTKKLIETMINFEQGKPYRSGLLRKLNSNLSATSYFSQIDIRPLHDQAKNYEVPIHLGVAPKTAHELETGIGFSTDEGPRVSLTWDKPWLNDKGHSISSSIAVSQINAEISSSYKIPTGNPLKDYFTLDVGYKKKNQDDTESELVTASIHNWKKRDDNWDRDIFFRVEYEDFTQGEQKGSSLLLIPGIAFSRRKVYGNNALDPMAGYNSNFKLEGAGKSLGSDANFLKFWTRTKALATLNVKHRFIGRIEQGAIWTNDIRDIPPSIRFFTGGDQSVRGYNFESISPKGKDDKLTGAKYMTAVSAEYDYEFIEKWRLALFVDSGTATNNYQVPWKIGTGFGVRWVTPLGPLKLDLAFAVNEPDTPWRIHFTMGPDI